MLYVGALISLQFIILTVYWLKRRYNPQGVLLLSGTFMLLTASFVGVPNTLAATSPGVMFFDIFKIIGQSFSTTMAHGGMMIVAIGGYALYVKHIRASEALVEVALQPMSLLHKYPYIAVCSLIPIGQMLFICIPSATGLALLLAASVLPILLKIGVSRLTAVSVITATTMFDLGPGSANTLEAAELASVSKLGYFIDYQLPFVVPMIAIMVVVYYFTSRYYDRKDALKQSLEPNTFTPKEPTGDPAPHIYAILPVLPLILLLLFSDYIHIFTNSMTLDITSATLMSLLISMLFELIRHRNMGVVFASLKSFWVGMGRSFTAVITLIVCAEIFSKGLISLGMVDAMMEITLSLGVPQFVICALMTLLVFLVAMLMGSGNAALFSFGPLAPDIASRLGVPAIELVLPMQLSASIGRTVSPIASVVIAVSEVGGVSVLDVVRRNLIPVAVIMTFMLLYNIIIVIY